MKYPIQHGIVTNWNDMETVWEYTFNKLHVNAADHTVLLTENPLTQKAHREKLVEIMFEKFNTPNIALLNRATLALNATGRTTGIVLNSGDGVNNCSPIYEGNVFAHAYLRSDVNACRDVTYILEKIPRSRHRKRY